MLDTDKLIISDLIAMAGNVSSNLEKENTELRNAMITFRNFLDSNTGTSETITTMKKIAGDYARDIEMCISANECDIKDASILMSSIGSEDLDGSVIIPAMKTAYSNYQYHDGECDRIAQIIDGLDLWRVFEIDWWGVQFVYHDKKKNNYYSEYQTWLKKSNAFDAINASTSSLFTYSETYRSIAREGLSALDGSITVDCINPSYSMDWLKDADCAASKEMVHSGVLPQSFFLTLDEKEKLKDCGYTDKDIMSLQSKCVSDEDRQFVRNLVNGDYTVAFGVDESSISQGIKEEMSVYAFRQLEPDGAGNYTDDSVKEVAKMNDALQKSDWSKDYILDLNGSAATSGTPVMLDGMTLDDVSEALVFNLTQLDYDKYNVAQRGLMVSAYDTVHKDEAKIMNDLFYNIPADTIDHYYSEDKSNIKYIVYTAQDPYKTMFLTYAPDIEIADYDWNETQHYSPDVEKMYVDFTDADIYDASGAVTGTDPRGASDPRGPYVTFFHEFMHAIDDVSVDDVDHIFADKEETKINTTYSRTVGGKEVYLQNVIEDDVRIELEDSANYAVTNLGIDISANPDAIDHVVAEIMSANSRDSMPDPTENQIYQEVLSYYGRYTIEPDASGNLAFVWHKGSIDNFSGPKNELLSDVIGGVTNNTVGGYGYGHRPDSDKLADVYTYWYYYDSKGNPIPTGAQSNEFLAEYFSYCITGSQDQLTNVNKVFGNSTQFADEMFKEMVK